MAVPYAFLHCDVSRVSVGRAFASLLRAQKWVPYTLLYRYVNASVAEAAEVPSEGEVNCDAFAFLYRVGGWAFWCKNAPKKRIKGARSTDCFIVDNSFGRSKLLMNSEIWNNVWWNETIKMRRGIVFGEKCITFADAT